MAVLCALVVPAVCYGQSTLSFPRVMQPQDFKTTGFAIVNPNSTSATITYTLYGEDGGIQRTTTQTVPLRGQLALLASELFPTATGTGWVQATSAAPGLEGFWFGGDFATFADGAEAATSSSELVLPLINPLSEIDIANTGTADVTVRLNIMGADGFDLAEPFPQRITAKGFFKADLASIFPTVEDPNLATHMRVVCACVGPSAFAATVIARNFIVGPSWAVENGVPASSSATTLYFPYVVEGPQGTTTWRSVLGLTNLSTTSSNQVTATFTPQTGGTPRINRQTLPPNGGVRFSAHDWFGITDFQTGWVSVTSTLPLTGFVAYADLVAAGVAVVPPQQDPQPKLLFAHIADLAPLATGLALLNPTTTPANIDVFAFTPSGTLIGTTGFQLAAASNISKLLRELIPQTQTRTSDGGFVFVRSTTPIFGIELFFSRDSRYFGNVPAGPGNSFVLPAP